MQSNLGKKRDDLKSVKNVLKMICGLYQAKLNAMARSANDPMSYMNVDAFFYHHIQQTYGLDNLANKYCDLYLASVMFHRNTKVESLKDQRIDLFARFVGVAPDRLPYSIYEKYMYMIKGVSVSLTSLFQCNLNTTFVDYIKVRHIYRDLLSSASDQIQK